MFPGTAGTDVPGGRSSPGRLPLDRRVPSAERATPPPTGGRKNDFRTSENFRRFRENLFSFRGNDPSAGSPTETLLRLLLPLNDQVQQSSQHTGSRAEPSRRD